MRTKVERDTHTQTKENGMGAKDLRKYLSSVARVHMKLTIDVRYQQIREVPPNALLIDWLASQYYSKGHAQN